MATTTENSRPNYGVLRLRQLAHQFGLEFIDLASIELDQELIESFPSQDLFRHCVLPLDRDGQRVRVAVGDPFKSQELDELTVATGCFLDTVLASEEQIKQHLNSVLGVAGGTVRDLVSRDDDVMEELNGDVDFSDANASSVGRVIHELLSEAVRQRASDIHIETVESDIVIRYRIDGMLQQQSLPPGLHRFQAAIISRLKIMCRLNIAEKRRPQDGRANVELEGRQIDIRASFIPMLGGEEVVLRLLDTGRVTTDLRMIELPEKVSDRWNELIRAPHGLLLVTGPTGSGKTTTLYSSLTEIQKGTNKIITVEDPVEYDLTGISQIQVQERVGMSFSQGLRSILRHDPDVILVGEIRDAETAAIAVQAALTGHLVLSTLHTNDAPSALTRLVDMGIEPYLVGTTLGGVLAQRLVRRLCIHCCEPYTPDDSLAIPPGCELDPDAKLYRAVGCEDCGGSGYIGRIAVFELLDVGFELRGGDLNDSTLREFASESGMETLAQSGWRRVLDGVTSTDEVMRVCCV